MPQLVEVTYSGRVVDGVQVNVRTQPLLGSYDAACTSEAALQDATAFPLEDTADAAASKYVPDSMSAGTPHPDCGSSLFAQIPVLNSDQTESARPLPSKPSCCPHGHAPAGLQPAALDHRLIQTTCV